MNGNKIPVLFYVYLQEGDDILKRLIRKIAEENNDNSDIRAMIYWWVDGAMHFQGGDRKFVAGERFEEEIDKAKELYPESIYNGACYRFITIDGNQINNYIEGLTYDSSNDSFTRDKSLFDVNNITENCKASIKQNLISGYGVYQAFSKNENFQWGYAGGAHIGLKITMNNVDGLDLNKIAEILDCTRDVVESDNEVVAKLRNDIEIEIIRISGVVD